MPGVEAGEEVVGQVWFVACDVGGFVGVGVEIGEVYFVAVEEEFVAVALNCAARGRDRDRVERRCRCCQRGPIARVCRGFCRWRRP